MQDYIVRATAAEGTVRAFAAVTTNMVKEARELHGLSPVASAALGRTLTGAAIMSRMLKGAKDTITIQVKGDGPLGGLVAVSDSEAHVRGYVYNSDVHIPLNAVGKLDVSGAIGKGGYMNVIKDLGLREPYIGYVDLISGEIAEDLAYYFASSEQVPSIVALGVLVDMDGSIINSGGYIIQLMPGANEETVEFLEKRIGSISSITTLLKEGNNPENILELILGGINLKIIDKAPCKYLCNCSRERMERNLISLERAELQSLIEDQHGAELQCHFCNKKYQFTEAELFELLNL